MKSRVGVRVAGFATIVAAALLAACGGGGGGGGSTGGTGVTPQNTPTIAPTGTPTTAPGVGATLPPISGSNQSGYASYDVATAFKYPVQSGYSGTGRTIAIVGDETPAPSDITTYESVWQIPVTGGFSAKNVSGVTPGGADSSGLGEATLDVETVIGLAPGANVVFYNTQGDLSNQAFLLAEQQVLADNPDVFSISFGGCEDYPVAQATAPPDAAVFASMAQKGIAVTVSSGDQGDQCFTGVSSPQFAFGANYPASDPSVIGVGGNESVPPNAATNPVAWNDTFFGNQSATGGGVSVAFATPSYQTGVAGIFSSSKRNVPDVAMPAEGVLITLKGKTQEFGGTSWSAPQTAAMMAELDQYCNGRPTNAVAELYKAYSQSSGSDFIDVTSGDNHYGSESVTYAAKAGYDNVSGLGLLKGMSIAQTVCPSRAWTGGVASALSPMMLQSPSYGPARDTVLPYVARFGTQADRGERTSESTNVLLLLRNTPTAAGDEQKVVSELTAHGFTVSQTFPNHSMIQVSAPGTSVARYFRTAIHNVDAGQYGMKYANAAPIVVPAAIAPYVTAVLADNLPARVPMHHVLR